VIQYKGLRIGGLTGIFKQHDYNKGHYEKPPYTEQSKRSVYHIRDTEVFRLNQLKQPIDIMLSHDWPNGVVHHGDKDDLLRKKKFFRDDVMNNCLGSTPAWGMLCNLRPKYWFSGHLHVKFAAIVEHELQEENCKNQNTTTRFLALDKCLPSRDFLQVLDVPVNENAPDGLQYDPEWLAILKETNHLTSISRHTHCVPTKGLHDRWDYSVDENTVEKVTERFGGDLTIPINFHADSSLYYDPANHQRYRQMHCIINSQTTEFCAKLEINDPMMMILQGGGADSSFNDSSFMSEDGGELPSTIVSNASINPDEIDLDDDDDDEDDDNEPSLASSLPLPRVVKKPSSIEDVTSSQSSLSSAEESDGMDVPKSRSSASLISGSPLQGMSATFSLPPPTMKDNSNQLTSTPQRTTLKTFPYSRADFPSLSSPSLSDSPKSCKRETDSDSCSGGGDAVTAKVAVKKFKRRNASMYASTEDEND